MAFAEKLLAAPVLWELNMVDLSVTTTTSPSEKKSPSS